MLNKLSPIFFLFTFSFSICSAQNVGIGTNTPNASAQLDVNSTNKGFLPPRMTYVERSNIPNPVAGLIVFCTDCGYGGEMQFYNGVAWTNIAIGTGSGLPVIDVDGNSYPTTTICNQTWMAKNLDVSKYTDGTAIPRLTAAQWAAATTGGWCYYGGAEGSLILEDNGKIYGKLYNWYAVAGIYDAASLTNPALRKKLAPAGWHIPTETEFNTLANCLGGLTVAGGKMKTTGTNNWYPPNTGANNLSGFSALPSGNRDASANFSALGSLAIYWGSNDVSNPPAFYLFSFSDDQFKTTSDKRAGYSIRCVKD